MGNPLHKLSKSLMYILESGMANRFHFFFEYFLKTLSKIETNGGKRLKGKGR